VVRAPDAGPTADRQGVGRVHPSGSPDLHYAVKYKRAFYGLPELGWIIEIAPYDVSVNVLFFSGADFTPPPPLGTTGRTRYVKVTTLEEGQRPELHEWIEQAARTPGWK
jgi:hypothetical protein